MNEQEQANVARFFEESDREHAHKFDTALGFVLDAVAETAVVEGEISLTLEPDGTQSITAAFRSEFVTHSPTVIDREGD